MVALPTGILATGFAAEIQRRRAVFADAATLVMADGVVDETEERYLEDVRVGLGLSKDEVHDLDPSPDGGAAPGRKAAQHSACPHCGEAL
jgi:hypothetical protein